MNTTPLQLALDFNVPVATALDDQSPRERRLDEARATLARGFAGVRDDPETLAAYLRFAARFTELSTRNRMLVFLQDPAARWVKGYRAWQKAGRQVRKGERALTILAPLLRKPTADEVAAGADPDRRVPFGYRAVHVFDISATDAVHEGALELASPVVRLDADGPAGLAERLEAAAGALGYTVEELSRGSADGRCRFADRVIEVRTGLSPADRAAVLAHELAHALAHDPAGDPAGKCEAATRASAELQAESVGFTVCAALGLDTERASLPYLKDWAGGDDDALCAELAAIDRIATRLLALVDRASESTNVDSPMSPATPS